MMNALTLNDIQKIHGVLKPGVLLPNSLLGDIRVDSRKVVANDIFIALAGDSSDGHSYLPQVVAQGASLLVVETSKNIPSDYQGAVLKVLDTTHTLKLMTELKFGELSRQFFGFAITGTNGKTSVSYMIEHLLAELGHRPGVLGTVDHHCGDKVWKSELTTPVDVDFKKRLVDFYDLGSRHFVAEVSSHALYQRRIDFQFDVAIFTNLSRDHLDYHSNMDEYFAAKNLLFKRHMKKQGSVAVVNGDDSYSSRIDKGNVDLFLTFGQGEGSDYQFEIKSVGLKGVDISLHVKNEKVHFTLPMVGLHNAYNAVASIAAVHSMGHSLEKLASAMSSFGGVPGRLQRVSVKRGVAYVDYAHTPEALKKALVTLRTALGTGRLICLFGCGGDRDVGKRSMMGEMSSELSDVTIITSDNPRSEDPQTIIDDILKGLKPEDITLNYVDRREAIAEGLKMMMDDDILLVAGKGHEQTQTIGEQVLPFCDVSILRELSIES